MDFYTVSIIIAIILLILVLTVIGVFMSKSTSQVPFPNFQSPCPDYWKMNPDGTCSKSDTINSFTDPNNAGSKLVYKNTGLAKYDDPVWDTAYPGKNSICAKQQFSKDAKILWDGVSNYNGCK